MILVAKGSSTSLSRDVGYDGSFRRDVGDSESFEDGMTDAEGRRRRREEWGGQDGKGGGRWEGKGKERRTAGTSWDLRVLP